MQKLIDQHIKRFGVSIPAIFSDGDRPGFAYTVGMTETYSHPEIIVMALPPQVAQAVLNHVAALVKAGAKFGDGDVSEEIANFPVMFKSITTGQASEYACQALYRYEGAARQPVFLQMVLTDAAGKFPWDEGYADAMKMCQTELWTIAQN